VDAYEHLWSGVKDKAEAAIAAGEKDLGRIHLATRRMFGKNFADEKLQKKYEHHESQKRQSGFILDRQLVQIHDMDSTDTTFITDAVKMREVIRAMGPDIERVIETGAGWAKTLMNLWRYGAPLNAEYWALELTRSGRAVAEMIVKAAASGPDLRTRGFDYYEPDFSFLAAETKQTCFVTHHSIEQIPELSESFIQAVLSVPGFHRCVHIEPVGWQIPTNNWLADASLCDKMIEIDEANRRFSLKKNQNRNLYPLLRTMEQEGKIKIHVVRKYLCSHLINNATILISWGPSEAGVPDYALRDDLRRDTSGRA
jgi:hypothetical protein